MVVDRDAWTGDEGVRRYRPEQRGIQGVAFQLDPGSGLLRTTGLCVRLESKDACE
jgi:hypothetical protein